MTQNINSDNVTARIRKEMLWTAPALAAASLILFAMAALVDATWAPRAGAVLIGLTCA